MKKLFRYYPAAVAGMGALAALLRLWLNGTMDENGLFGHAFLPRFLLWIVTLVAAGGIGYGFFFMKSGKKYATAFPASPVAAGGMALGGICIGISSVASLLGAGDILGIVTAVLGLAATAILLLTAKMRYEGKKPDMLLPGVVDLYLIFKLLDGFRLWGSAPQIDWYLFRLLACIFLMLASYQWTAFCYGKGSRKYQALTSLAALYFCIGALPGSGDVLFFLGAAVWMGTNVCVIRRKK